MCVYSQPYLQHFLNFNSSISTNKLYYHQGTALHTLYHYTITSWTTLRFFVWSRSLLFSQRTFSLPSPFSIYILQCLQTRRDCMSASTPAETPIRAERIPTTGHYWSPQNRRTKARARRGNDSIPPWQYKVVPLRGVQTSSLLVRITVAKVEDLAQLERTLSQVPVAQYQGFTCRTWVADAVAALDQSGSLGTKRTDNWNTIQDFATRYVKRKKDAGRWRTQGKWNLALPATFSLVEDKEIFPWVSRCYQLPPVKDAIDCWILFTCIRFVGLRYMYMYTYIF